MSSAGYSRTPLIRKLGFKSGHEIVLLGAPPGYADWIGELPPGAVLMPVDPADLPAPILAAHVFSTREADLAAWLPALRSRFAQNGFAWVSWPKKAARVPTDVSEDVVRSVALPLGFVDIKVCAVTEVWSGLKLVIRRSERQP